MDRVVDLLDKTLTDVEIPAVVKTIGHHVLHYFCFAQWAQDGLNTFDVTASLAAGLLLTEPSDELSFLRLPFRSFHVKVPSGFIPLHVRDGDALEVRYVTRIMVNQYDVVVDGVRVAHVRFCGTDETGQVPDLSYGVTGRV